MHKAGAKRKPTRRFNDSTVQWFNSFTAEICILAGGLSQRMGRDKSRLRMGPTTMLGHIRKTAQATGLPVRIIRRDCVPKCGPLGGIFTALKSTKSDVVLVLACDMPFVSTELIEYLLRKVSESLPEPSMESRLQTARHPPVRSPHTTWNGATECPKTPFRGALFVRSRGRAGFPFFLHRNTIETVNQQIEKGDFSLQTLAKAVEATILPLARAWARQLFNVNTPEDWETARTRLQRIHRPEC